MTKSHEKDKFVIRLSDGLRPAISAQAKNNLRSMNNEIIHRLERSLELEVLYDNQVKLNAVLTECIKMLQTTSLTIDPLSVKLPDKGEP